MPVDGPLYPVNLVLRGRRCLVVGAGPVAAGKVRGLLEAGAEVTVVAPSVGDEVRAVDGITVEQRPYRAGEAGDYHLVITATGDRSVDQAVYDDAEAARVWVNSADDPQRCSFTLPARVRRGDLLLTVATGGRSPALSKWLRTRLEAEIGPEYATLLDLLAAERSTRHAAGTGPPASAWQAALDSGMLELVREGRLADAKKTLSECLSSSSA